MNPGDDRNVPFAQVWLLEVLNYLRVLDYTTKGIMPEDKRLEWFVSPSPIVSSPSCIVCNLGMVLAAKGLGQRPPERFFLLKGLLVFGVALLRSRDSRWPCQTFSSQGQRNMYSYWKMYELQLKVERSKSRPGSWWEMIWQTQSRTEKLPRDTWAKVPPSRCHRLS